MAKYKKKDWFSMDPIKVWHIVRKGKELKVFPNNFLDKETCIILVRELILNELHMTREEILNIDQNLLSNYSLGGVRKFFDCKLYNVIFDSFPELNIKSWELKKAPNECWKDIEVRNDFVRTIAKKENIDLNKTKDLSRFSAVMINSHGGHRALTYAGGLYELIKPVIPSEIKEWQIFKVAKWDEEKAVQAIKWLIEEKLNWDNEQIYNNLSASVFYKNNLGGLLSKFCNHSPLKAINLAYPNEFDSLKNQKSINFI